MIFSIICLKKSLDYLEQFPDPVVFYVYDLPVYE